jgi:hypothetical protein
MSVVYLAANVEVVGLYPGILMLCCYYIQTYIKKIFDHLFLLAYTQWQCILSYDNSTAMYKFLKNLAGFEPGIFCFVGGRDDHYTTPPGHIHTYKQSEQELASVEVW